MAEGGRSVPRATTLALGWWPLAGHLFCVGRCRWRPLRYLINLNKAGATIFVLQMVRLGHKEFVTCPGSLS